MKIKNLTKLVAAITVCVTAFVSIPLSNADLSVDAADSNTVIYDLSEESSYKNRTLQDVISQYNKAISYGEDAGYVNRDSSTFYSVASSTSSPYNQGTLKQSTLMAMQGMTNFYRWLVGNEPLQTDCVNSDYLQYQALDRNFEFNHYISNSSKPDDMDDALWEKGYECTHNILASGYTPRGAIIGWMNEGYSLSSRSWDTLGHRYALISPTLSEIQFGYCGRIAVGDCVSYNNTSSNSIYAFPSPGYMPSNLIYPTESSWAVDFENVDISLDEDNVSVEITNLNTGTSYIRSSSDNTVSAYNGHISFVQPEDYDTDSRSYTDSYKVVISGLTDSATGKNAQIQYTVDFFDIVPYAASYVTSAESTDFTDLIVYKSLNDTESLKKIAAVLPDEIEVEAASGYTFTLPVKGHWVLDEANQCWTNSADTSKLPSNIKDKNGVLKKVTIPYSISDDYYDSYNRFFINPSSPSKGQSGYMSIYRTLVNDNGSSIFKIVKNSDGTYSGIKKYDTSSAEFDAEISKENFPYHYYIINSFSKEDSGEYVSIYYNTSPTWRGSAYVSTSIVRLTVDSQLGDVDDSGAIDAIDASLVLTAYAMLATNQPVNLDSEHLSRADVNADGNTDALDASIILNYYAYSATGGTEVFEDFIK